MSKLSLVGISEVANCDFRKNIPKLKMFLKKKNLSKREIARFSNQLKMLLSSGVPLLKSLRIVNSISKHNKYEILAQRLSEGESLAVAMRGHFPPMVISSVAGAEKAGNLEEVLGRLAKYYEERAETEEKIKSSLLYPCFVIFLSLVSLIVIFMFVLPGFKEMFVDLETELPIFTQIIMGGGEFILATWYIPFIVCFVLGILFVRFQKTDQGKFKIDSLLLQIRFLQREQVCQGFRTLGSLLGGGIPIVEAFKTTIDSIKNRAFKKIILEIKESVENGERLSEVFSRYRIFPQEAIQMISVGEGVGNLSDMLLSIADFYEKEREVFIKRFTSLLEPALTLFVGIIVGVIAISMFLPMINVISELQ